MLQCVALFCSMLQCVATCCIVLQCIAVRECDFACAARSYNEDLNDASYSMSPRGLAHGVDTAE